MIETTTPAYRKDIDGLRAIAVLAVILHHLGYLPNGYLGVDIFFSISGYLITTIIYRETSFSGASVIGFYLRRIRRIIPMILLVSLASLITGLIVMLPDDLENLCQSIIATNFFSNNVLLLLTSFNYWNGANDYKPLMHTWSLGIEEQFYLLYPFIFLLFSAERKRRFITPLLIIFTSLSVLQYLYSSAEAAKFYLLPYRFFELSLGGLAAILFMNKPIHGRYHLLSLSVILAILLFNWHLPNSITLLLTAVSSAGILIPSGKRYRLSTWMLQNKLMAAIGKISFSLYMWHQMVLAYTRYFLAEQIGWQQASIIIVLVFLLSILSYFLIEQPFRNKQTVSTKALLFITGVLFVFINSSAFYIYSIGGIIKDVPELALYKLRNGRNGTGSGINIHVDYNTRIFHLDKNFSSDRSYKVLVAGNSFARDFCNILLESNCSDSIEISYIPDISSCHDAQERLNRADYIFFSEMTMPDFTTLSLKFGIDKRKVRNAGTRNFGFSNGIFYNKRKDAGYCLQRTRMKPGFIEKNQLLKRQWGVKYIDLTGPIADKNGRVPVFTNDCRFISADCRHLTQAGAKYFAQKINLDSLFTGR